jgi:hypothetical protein
MSKIIKITGKRYLIIIPTSAWDVVGHPRTGADPLPE